MKKKQSGHDDLNDAMFASYGRCYHEGEWIAKGFWIFKRHYLRCHKCGKDIRDKYIPV